MLWRPRCLVPVVLLLSLVLMPASPAAAALDGASLAAARLTAPRAARVAHDAGYHVCHDIWEALNPLAPCVIDPVRPLADATGNAVKAALHDLVVTTLDGLTDDLRAVFVDWQGLAILSVTPHQVSDTHPDVIALWSLCRAIALALLALLIVGAGLEIMRSKEAGRAYAGPLDALQAIVVCALLANVSLGVSGLLIELSNRICGLVAGGVTLPAIVATPADPLSESIAHALFRLLYIVVACALLVQMLVRLALLDLAIVLAPLGILAHAAPRTRRLGLLWADTTTTLAIQQFVQVLALRFSATVLGHLGASDDMATQVLLGVASMIVVFRVPRLLGGLHALGHLPTLGGLVLAAQQAAPRSAAPASRAAQPAPGPGGGTP